MSTSTLRPSRAVRALAAFGCALLPAGTAACGSDGDDTATSTTSAAAPSSNGSNGKPGEGDLAAYCNASLAIEGVEPDIDFDTATSEEITAALKAFATDDLQPIVDGAVDVAPAELADDVEVYRDAIEELAENGDPSVFDDPALADAEATTHAYELEHCGWQTAEVVATDYAFAGLDATYEARPLSIDLTNEGDEVHELLVLKVKDGVTESADAILAMSEDEAFANIDMVAGIDPVPAGGSDFAIVELEPGRYIATCFLPKGSTDVEHLEGHGQPHVELGMISQFTVI